MFLNTESSSSWVNGPSLLSNYLIIILVIGSCLTFGRFPCRFSKFCFHSFICSCWFVTFSLASAVLFLLLTSFIVCHVHYLRQFYQILFKSIKVCHVHYLRQFYQILFKSIKVCHVHYLRQFYQILFKSIKVCHVHYLRQFYQILFKSIKWHETIQDKPSHERRPMFLTKTSQKLVSIILSLCLLSFKMHEWFYLKIVFSFFVKSRLYTICVLNVKAILP